jgi:tetratricopeptide (TPR) repeat protein
MAQYDQALQYYVRALDLRRNDGDKRSAAIESSAMGTLFAYQGRYGAALSSEEDAIKTMRDIQERGFWLADVLGSYGHALAEVGRNDDAQKSLDEAMSVAREQKNEAKIAELLDYDGDNAFYREDYKSAAALYDQAVQKASHTTDAHLILISKVNAAKITVKEGRFQTASSALRSLSQEADNMGVKYVSVNCSIYLSEALIGMKSYGLAKNELQSALSRSEKLGLQGLLAQSHFLLARTLELSGKTAEAQDHYKQARQIADSIQKEAHTDTITKRSDLSPIYTHAA